MAPAISPAWRNLPIADSNQIHDSVLFFTFKRYADGLKLHITDLIHIWASARTSKEELKEEAVRTRCSIDPSEDEEQYEVLLTKLEEAVSGRNGATVQLVGDKKSSTPVRFEIEASIPLPVPLGVLEWTFQMVRQEPSVLTEELVIPTLCVIDASRRREEDLRRRIKEKDHVIGKLMDKIEGSGIDLSMVFPGFAGVRKGLNSRQAAKVVPGIEAFREGEWGRNPKDRIDGGFEKIVDALKDSETGKVVWRAPMSYMRGSNSDKPGDGYYSYASGSKVNQQKPVKHSADDTDSSEAPSSSHGAFRRSSSSNSSPAPVRSREPSSKPRKTKLAALGGLKTKPIPTTKQKSLSATPERQTRTSKQLSPASSATATDSESESGRGRASPREATSQKSNSKMGIIGGRKNQTACKDKTKSPKPSAQTSQVIPSKANSRLGAIGCKKAETVSPPRREHDSTASPSPSPPPGSGTAQPITDPKWTTKGSISPSKPEEPMTEAARADRKRIELKRQLNDGAGRKKKRKF